MSRTLLLATHAVLMVGILATLIPYAASLVRLRAAWHNLAPAQRAAFTARGRDYPRARRQFALSLGASILLTIANGLMLWWHWRHV